LASEVSRSPFARASVHVKAKKRVPMAFQYAGARQKLDLNAIGKSLLSFAPDHLSLARGKIGQEGIEIGIALVEKMKLLSAALQKAACAEQFPFAACWKSDVKRGCSGLGAQSTKTGNQSLACLLTISRRKQESAAGDWRERHGDLQFGIIAHPCAVIGVRPAMIDTYSPMEWVLK
jgi:hypothetical protein